MMNRTELTMDQMELVNGGTQAEAEARKKHAIEKVVARGKCQALMTASSMHKLDGMVSVPWHAYDDQAAAF